MIGLELQRQKNTRNAYQLGDGIVLYIEMRPGLRVADGMSEDTILRLLWNSSGICFINLSWEWTRIIRKSGQCTAVSL